MGCRNSGRTYQGFQSKNPKPRRIIEDGSATVGPRLEDPRNTQRKRVRLLTIGHECGALWMKGGGEELKRSRWPEAPAGMVYRLPGNRLCRPTSCRQRGDSGSEWAGCRGSRRAQASWSAWKGLHRSHSQGSRARGLRRLPNHDRHRRVALSNWAAQARPINGQTTPTNNLKKPCYWVQENSHERIRVRA